MNQKSCRKYLYVAAHPDDADLLFGGTALKLIAAGHQVGFVVLTDGSRGHHVMRGEALVERRRQEAHSAAQIAGVSPCVIWDVPDGELEPSLENRKRLIRLMRNFAPDVVISHRTCDYHPDHRAVGQLVMDCSFLYGVPNLCPEVAVPEGEWPVFASSYDQFTMPAPMRVDAAVAIDSVIDRKIQMLDCHKSQFYEWLAYLLNHQDITGDWSEKRQWLEQNWVCRDEAAALYGQEFFKKHNLKQPRYAEVFEHSEYGRQISLEEFVELFNI